MKVSYKILKKYIPYLESSQKVADDLIMHTAEVEEIHSEKKDFENIVFWKITKVEKHPDADSLKVCQVNVWEKEDIQIVCGWSNVEAWLWVAVAKIWASVVWHWEWEPVIMKKTAIRWVESLWMICASEEIWLAEEFPSKSEKEILDLSFLNILPWTNLADALWKDDEVLEIDNKAINHRPDMFSYMWVIREIETINGKETPHNYLNEDFSKLQKLEAKNLIPEYVKRYSLLKVNWVTNIESNEEIKTIIKAAGHTEKWLLVDVSNYSLYFYWQPVHIFDADTLEWNIEVRFAKLWEKFVALDNKEYELTDKDIVIADNEKVLALWWIIWWKSSSVSDSTKNIIIESANFDQAILRMTWKRLWVRTDALNVFEKEILLETASRWTSLVLSELKKVFPNLEVISYFDSYENKQKDVKVPFDLNFINNLIWAEYRESEVLEILKNLWVKKSWNDLEIPFWRKELTTKADIAEEIARISGYDKVKTTVPRINLWAIMQDKIYNLKNDVRSYFSSIWFFDVYNYSFVNAWLYEKLWLDINECISLKNSLSEEATHMKNSLIPNLMLWLEENIRTRKDLKLFEIEKAFFKKWNEISEKYLLSGVMTSEKNIVYYDIQNILSNFLKNIFVDNFHFDILENIPSYAHSGRTAKIIARWKEIWIIWEIHPNIAKKFDVKDRIWFFEIDAEKLSEVAYNIAKAKEISTFQENNFDLSFVVDKKVKWRHIKTSIECVDKDLIKKVELFDIYESEEKLPWKRSLSFKVYIQSFTWTLDDNIKNELIKKIVDKIEKLGWSLR